MHTILFHTLKHLHQGCIKLHPPLKLFGKKIIKWGRRKGGGEGKREEAKGRKGKARWKRRKREEGGEKGSEREGNQVSGNFIHPCSVHK